MTTTRGSIARGNGSGDGSIAVNVGTISGSGATAVIEFRVRIAATVLAGTDRVANQGIVSGSNFPSVVTDDPATPTPGDPTVTPLRAAPVLASTKRVTLGNDADANGRPSPGDRLDCTVTIANTGNQGATGVGFTDSPDPSTTLVGPSTASLGAGKSLRVTLRFRVLSSAGGRTTLKAGASASNAANATPVGFLAVPPTPVSRRVTG